MAGSAGFNPDASQAPFDYYSNYMPSPPKATPSVSRDASGRPKIVWDVKAQGDALNPFGPMAQREAEWDRLKTAVTVTAPFKGGSALLLSGGINVADTLKDEGLNPSSWEQIKGDITRLAEAAFGELGGREILDKIQDAVNDIEDAIPDELKDLIAQARELADRQIAAANAASRNAFAQADAVINGFPPAVQKAFPFLLFGLAVFVSYWVAKKLISPLTGFALLAVIVGYGVYKS